MAIPNDSSNLRSRVITAAAVAGAFIGAAGIAGAAVSSDSDSTLESSVVATQADDTTSATDTDADTDTTVSDNATNDDADTDATRGGHGDRVSTEEALTGDLADQVTAAALDAVPGGTIERVETDDGDAAYEAHMTNADGDRVTVTFDDNLALIEIIEDGGRGGHGGGGHGDHGDRVSTEEALTGDLADQVTAAALDAVPGGTIERVETDDGDAAYEAHMTNADGDRVTVTFDDNLALIEIIEGH